MLNAVTEPRTFSNWEPEILSDAMMETRLSKAQRKTIEALKREIWRRDTYASQDPGEWNTGKHEVKRWEIVAQKDELAPGIVFLYSVIGRRGDEGTMAEALCRNTRHILIGRRGGCRLLNAAKWHKENGEPVLRFSKAKVCGVVNCAMSANR